MTVVRQRSGRVATTAAATVVALVALLAATISPTWAWVTTAPAGGPVNFVGTNITFTDIQANQTFSCTTFSPSGTVSVPAGTNAAYGASVANLTTVTSSGCANPIGGGCPILAPTTWGFVLTGPPTGDVWPSRFTNVKLVVACGGCSFMMEGVINGRFDRGVTSPTYQRFTPVTGPSGLVVSASPAPSGFVCTVLDIQAGDDIEVGGYWTNTGTPI